MSFIVDQQPPPDSQSSTVNNNANSSSVPKKDPSPPQTKTGGIAKGIIPSQPLADSSRVDAELPVTIVIKPNSPTSSEIDKTKHYNPLHSASANSGGGVTKSVDQQINEVTENIHKTIKEIKEQIALISEKMPSKEIQDRLATAEELYQKITAQLRKLHDTIGESTSSTFLSARESVVGMGSMLKNAKASALDILDKLSKGSIEQPNSHSGLTLGAKRSISTAKNKLTMGIKAFESNNPTKAKEFLAQTQKLLVSAQSDLTAAKEKLGVKHELGTDPISATINELESQLKEIQDSLVQAKVSFMLANFPKDALEPPATSSGKQPALGATSGDSGLLGVAASAGGGGSGIPPTGISSAAAVAASAASGPSAKAPVSTITAAEIAKYSSLPQIKGKNTSVQILEIFNELKGKLDPKQFKVSAQINSSPISVIHNNNVLFKFECEYTVTLNDQLDAAGQPLVIRLKREIFTNSNNANTAQIMAKQYLTSQSEMAMANIDKDFKGTLGELSTKSDAEKRKLLDQPVLSFRLNDEGGGQITTTDKSLGSFSFQGTKHPEYNEKEGLYKANGKRNFKTLEQETLHSPLPFTTDYRSDQMTATKTIPTIIKKDNEIRDNIQKGLEGVRKQEVLLKDLMNKQILLAKHKEMISFVDTKIKHFAELQNKMSKGVSDKDYDSFLKGFEGHLKFKGTKLLDKLKEAEAFLKLKQKEFQDNGILALFNAQTIRESRLAKAQSDLQSLLGKIPDQQRFLEQVKGMPYYSKADDVVLTKEDVRDLNDEIQERFGLNESLKNGVTVKGMKSLITQLGYFQAYADNVKLQKDKKRYNPTTVLTPSEVTNLNQEIETLFGIKNQFNDKSKVSDVAIFIKTQQHKMGLPIVEAEREHAIAKGDIKKHDTEAHEQRSEFNRLSEKLKNDIAKLKDMYMRASSLKKAIQGNKSFEKDSEELDTFLASLVTIKNKYDKSLKEIEDIHKDLITLFPPPVVKTKPVVASVGAEPTI